MSYLFFAWLACFGYGLSSVIAKLTSKHGVKNPYLLNFLWSLFFLIFLLPLLPFHPLTIPTHWVSLTITAVLWAITGVLYVVILAKMDISALAPLFNLRTAFSVLLGVVFLGEHLTPGQYLLVTVILLAGILVNLDEHFSLRSLLKPLMALVLLEMFLLTLYNASLKIAIAENGYWPVFYWATILSQILILPTIPLFWKDLFVNAAQGAASVRGPSLDQQGGILERSDLPSLSQARSSLTAAKPSNKWRFNITFNQLAVVALIAFVSLLSNLAANKAFEQNIALSSAIISLPVSMVLAFLFSVFAPNLLEKHTLKIYAIRFSAAAVMFLAALRLSA